MMWWDPHIYEILMAERIQTRQREAAEDRLAKAARPSPATEPARRRFHFAVPSARVPGIFGQRRPTKHADLSSTS
jgi:hypothetical protein